jgi:hypothetical protein
LRPPSLPVTADPRTIALVAKKPAQPNVRPRKTSEIVATRPGCKPLREMYAEAVKLKAQTFSQIEDLFLEAMSEFDYTLAKTIEGPDDPKTREVLAADLQNGKGDFFNDLLALLLENSAGIDHLYARRAVPGLIIREHNLDGVFPDDGDIEFLMEAKMMGTPRHAASTKQKPWGRRGSADTGKRVKELAFKSIDLKGEYSRRRAMAGHAPAAGGPGGGDLTSWLQKNKPEIFFFMAVRVVNDTDFNAVVRHAETATAVVNHVGLYCYGPIDDTRYYTRYAARRGVSTVIELDRKLEAARLELQRIAAMVPVTTTAPGPAEGTLES